MWTVEALLGLTRFSFVDHTVLDKYILTFDRIYLEYLLTPMLVCLENPIPLQPLIQMSALHNSLAGNCCLPQYTL